MNTNSYFSELKNALERRNSTIRTALENYRTQAARITARYSEAVAKEELYKAEATARATIEAADESAHDAAERVTATLRGKLAEHIVADADPGLLAKLQAAQSFGLKLTGSEIEAMAGKANGDPVALACLEQVAEKSGYSLTFTTTADLESDLRKISSMFSAPSHYTPDDLFTEGLRCHPDRAYMGVNYGRPDAAALSVRQGSHKSAPADLDGMSARWASTDTVEVKQLTPTM